jgi:hypothetical protein
MECFESGRLHKTRLQSLACNFMLSSVSKSVDWVESKWVGVCVRSIRVILHSDFPFTSSSSICKEKRKKHKVFE